MIKLEDMSSEKESYPCFVQVTDDDTLENVIELPTEKDGTILLSTVQAQYTNAIGLKYRSASGAWRGVRLSENVLDPPYEGWGSSIYHIALPKTDSVKRKMEESPNREPEAKLVKTGSDSDFLSDLIVLGLPYKADETDLKEYFQQFGELAMHEIKCDPVSKESRGFGFIRYKNASPAQKVLKMNHSILGRRCEVRMPKKKLEQLLKKSIQDIYGKAFNKKMVLAKEDEMPLKLFVGRLGDNIKDTDLREYFGEFGELKDVYIPNPFRGFGFITFASSDVAREVLHRTHTLKENRLNVTYAEPKGEVKSSRGGGGSSGRDPYRRDRDERDRDRDRDRYRDDDRRSRSHRSQDPPFDFEDMRQLMFNSRSGYAPAGYSSYVPSRESSRSVGSSSRDDDRSSRSSDVQAVQVPFNPYLTQQALPGYPASAQPMSYTSQYGSYWSPAANK